MKKRILIFSLIVITFSCKAQDNIINSSEATINGISFLGNDNDVALVTQHLGQPNTIEDYYFEMDDLMGQEYQYNGILFHIANNRVEFFEITGSGYSFTKHNIKVGNNIETLSSIYPLSFADKGRNWLSLYFDDIYMHVTIFFDDINKKIVKIRINSNE